MKIQRKRYVIMRNNRTEIMVGSSRRYHFRPVDEVKNVEIKTYMSENKAHDACMQWSQAWLGDFEIVPVIETVESEGNHE